MMKRILIVLMAAFLWSQVSANDFIIKGPDGGLQVSVFLKGGVLIYTVDYKGKTIMEDSPLGLITNVSDFSKELQFVELQERVVRESYYEPKIKQSQVDYHANEVVG